MCESDWKRGIRWFFLLLGRLCLLLVIVFGIVEFAALVIRRLDSLDIVNRSSAAFAPFASSLPWLLVLLAVGMVLCIPSAPTALLAILKRVKKVGPFEFYPSEDPDNKADEQLSIKLPVPDSGSEKAIVRDPRAKLSDKAKSTLVELLTPEQRKAFFKRLHDNRRRKDNILCLHAGRIGATIDARNIRLKWSPVHFDASLVRDSERFLVRVVDACSDSFRNIVDELGDLAGRIQTDSEFHATIHVLVFEKAARNPADAKEGRRQAEWQAEFKNRQHLQFFFFFVDENNAIKTTEESR